MNNERAHVNLLFTLSMFIVGGKEWDSLLRKEWDNWIIFETIQEWPYDMKSLSNCPKDDHTIVNCL